MLLLLLLPATRYHRNYRPILQHCHNIDSVCRGMSELGDEAVSTGGAGGGQCVSATRTSELMSVVESVMPAAPSAVAPADSLPSAAAAAAAVAVPSSEERVATLLVTEDVTAHPAVRSKSPQTCRKRCRPNEVGLATQLSAVHTCAALRRAGYNASRVLTSGPVSTGIGDRGVFVYHLGM